MNPQQIAQLLAQLIPLGINLYNELQAANADQLKPIADVLKSADVKWDQVITTAQNETHPPATE